MNFYYIVYKIKFTIDSNKLSLAHVNYNNFKSSGLRDSTEIIKKRRPETQANN
jgi:hypothetical protein